MTHPPSPENIPQYFNNNSHGVVIGEEETQVQENQHRPISNDRHPSTMELSEESNTADEAQVQENQHRRPPADWSTLERGNEEQRFLFQYLQTMQEANSEYSGIQVCSALQTDFSVYSFTRLEVICNYPFYNRLRTFLEHFDISIPNSVCKSKCLALRLMGAIWQDELSEGDALDVLDRYYHLKGKENPFKTADTSGRLRKVVQERPSNTSRIDQEARIHYLHPTLQPEKQALQEKQFQTLRQKTKYIK